MYILVITVNVFTDLQTWKRKTKKLMRNHGKHVPYVGIWQLWLFSRIACVGIHKAALANVITRLCDQSDHSFIILLLHLTVIDTLCPETDTCFSINEFYRYVIIEMIVPMWRHLFQRVLFKVRLFCFPFQYKCFDGLPYIVISSCLSVSK